MTSDNERRARTSPVGLRRTAFAGPPKALASLLGAGARLSAAAAPTAPGPPAARPAAASRSPRRHRASARRPAARRAAPAGGRRCPASTNQPALASALPAMKAALPAPGCCAPTAPTSSTVSTYTCGLSRVKAAVCASTRGADWRGRRPRRHAARRGAAHAARPGRRRPARNSGAAEGQQRRQRRQAVEHPAHAEHADGDQQRVGRGAEQNHRQHVLAPQALAQHEGVLRADGDDQPRRQGESGGEARGGRAIHAPIIGAAAESVQLTFLRLH